MEFRDRSLMLGNIFLDEMMSGSYNGWGDFIRKKDLGVEYMYLDDFGDPVDVYRITDERKWMLTKIKYGI